eukprot:snap_masked-scaffold_18-processed-gene-1.23-mRNA-1 protein AED:1.00 eAED:1.00 QI:0/-1/0/0/-1/1/1/0/315
MKKSNRIQTLSRTQRSQRMQRRTIQRGLAGVESSNVREKSVSRENSRRSMRFSSSFMEGFGKSGKTRLKRKEYVVKPEKSLLTRLSSRPVAKPNIQKSLPRFSMSKAVNAWKTRTKLGRKDSQDSSTSSFDSIEFDIPPPPPPPPPPDQLDHPEPVFSKVLTNKSLKKTNSFNVKTIPRNVVAGAGLENLMDKSAEYVHDLATDKLRNLTEKELFDVLVSFLRNQNTREERYLGLDNDNVEKKAKLLLRMDLSELDRRMFLKYKISLSEFYLQSYLFNFEAELEKFEDYLEREDLDHLYTDNRNTQVSLRTDLTV